MGIQSPLSALEEQRMRLIMSGAPEREIYNNLQSIIELRTNELHQHKEQRPKLPARTWYSWLHRLNDRKLQQ